jgi:hypothetical protein
MPIKENIVGAWSLVSVVSESANGLAKDLFGQTPKGVIIFTADGFFSLLQASATLPRIASNDRAKATAEEALALVRGSIAYYGAYTVNEADETLTVRLEASTYPNVVGEQTRIVTLLTAQELKFDNPKTPNGATLRTVWQRARAHRADH